MASCYWPLNLHFVAWVAMVPWLASLPKLKSYQVLLFGSILGLVYYRLTLGWLFEMSGPHGAGVIIIFALLIGIAFCVVRILMGWLGQTVMLWATPICFAGQEILRSESLDTLRFAYAVLGYSQTQNLWIAQIASLGGVYFISFLLVAVNSAIAYGVVRKSFKSWLPAGITTALILILGFFSQPPSYEVIQEIPVACVQIESSYYRLHRDLTAESLNSSMKPRFVVLPEHTITDYADEKHYLIKELGKLAEKHKAYICVGAHLKAPRGADCHFDNVALMIGPDGRMIYHQAKTIPIPFFIDGNPATQQGTVNTEYGSVGCYVCYDSDFTDVIRMLAASGAELFLGPVMNPDDWPAAQRWQQADMAVFRSIETRRCAVRAASSGISQIIDATGKVRSHRTQQEGPGIVFGKIYFVNDKTIFLKYGYYFSHIIGWIFLILTLLLPITLGIKCFLRLMYWIKKS